MAFVIGPERQRLDGIDPFYRLPLVPLLAEKKDIQAISTQSHASLDDVLFKPKR